MSTLKKKSKKHSGGSQNAGGSQTPPEVQLDDRSKRFIYALAAIGGILVAVLAILELTK